MKKRDFLKNTGLLLAGVSVLGLGCKPTKNVGTNTSNGNANNNEPNKAMEAPATGFKLPTLNYAYTALSPAIDAQTVEIHYSKHHAAYVDNLNKAVVKNPSFAGKSLEQICAQLTKSDTEIALRNNAGGHYNHSLYWRTIGQRQPKQKLPEGKFLEDINRAFGDFNTLLQALKDASLGQFGSGWAWLSVNAQNKLFVSSTPNQDNPLMTNLVALAGKPILGIDVWEHAYYLNYQNKRKDYVEALLGIVLWDEVAKNYEQAMRG
jgi:superoxide dismutase, Fe-Mn family